MNPLNNNSPFNGPLTPHQFRQNQSTIATTSPTGSKTGGKSFPTARYAPLILGGLALLVLPITIWQINQQQDIRQQASQVVPSEQRPVARVGNEFLTDEDVDLEYTKQQNATTYLATPSSLKNQILDDLINKKLIEIEARKRNISVTDEEIDEKIKMLQQFDPNSTINRELTSDMLYAEKVAVAVSPSLTVNMIHSNISNEATKSFMDTVRTQALSNENLPIAALPYSNQSNDIELYQNIVTPQNSIFFTNIGNELVSQLDPTDISEVFEDKGRLYIVEIISKKESEFDSFEQFLDTRRSENAQVSSDN